MQESTTQLLNLSYFDLMIGFCLILISIGLSKWKDLRLEKDLLIAGLRTFLQLIGMGFLLKYVFESNHSVFILAFILIMLLVAVWTVVSKQTINKSGLSIIVGISLLASSGVTLFIVTQIIINIEPWFSPQYLIPIAGMILGNSMNGASLAIDRLDSDIKDKKDKIEALLCLGATSSQAGSKLIKSSMKAALIPMLNTMLVVGIVSIPGIMTGQILSGVSPLTAVKYQIIIMYMLAFSIILTSYIITTLRLRSYFTKYHQLKQI